MQWHNAASAQTKFNDVIDRLNRLSHGGKAGSFILQRAKQDAHNLAELDAADAHELLGIIASLEMDVAETHYRHRLAVNLSPNRRRSIGNYAISLGCLGLFDAASQQIESVVELFPNDKKSLHLLIEYSFRAGRLRRADRWLTLWHSRVHGERHASESLIVPMLEFARRYEITDDDLTSSIAEAVEISRVDGLVPSACSMGLQRDDESEWLCYRLGVKGSPSKLAELTARLADRFAELQQRAELATRFLVGFELPTADTPDGGYA